jgi:hypothetical protein
VSTTPRRGKGARSSPRGDAAGRRAPATIGYTAIKPDPDAYDSPRARIARARGLATPYIPGGDDPDPDAARREERYFLRILLLMIAIVVLGAFVLGVVENLIGG